MKTIYDWIFYCTEAQFCNVALYDNDIGDTVFVGSLSEVPEKYQSYEVQSFDPVDRETTCLTLNIGIEE